MRGKTTRPYASIYVPLLIHTQIAQMAIVTLDVKEIDGIFSIVAGSLTFREASLPELAFAVRGEMRIEKFRFVLPDGTILDHDFTRANRYPNERNSV